MEDWVKDFCNWSNESPVKPVSRQKQSRRRSLRILKRKSVNPIEIQPLTPLLIEEDEDNERLSSGSSIDRELLVRNEPKKTDKGYGTVWVELGENYEDFEKPTKKRRESVKQNFPLNQFEQIQERSIQPDKENLGKWESAESQFNDEVDRLWSDLDSLALISSDLPKTKTKRRQSFYRKERRRSRILKPIQNLVDFGMSKSPFIQTPVFNPVASSSENHEKNCESSSSTVNNLHREKLISQSGSFSFSPQAVCVVENMFQFSDNDIKNNRVDTETDNPKPQCEDTCPEFDEQNSNDRVRLVNIVDMGTDVKYNVTQKNFTDLDVESVTDFKSSPVDNTYTSPADTSVSGAHQRPLDLPGSSSNETNPSILKGFADRLFGTSDSPELCRSATPESGISKMKYCMEFDEPVYKKVCLDDATRPRVCDVLNEESYCKTSPDSSFSNKPSIRTHLVNNAMPTINKTAESPVFIDLTAYSPRVNNSPRTICTSTLTVPFLPTAAAGASADVVMESTTDVVLKSIEIPSCSTTSATIELCSPELDLTSPISESSPLRNNDTLEVGRSPVLSSGVSRIDYYLSKNLIDLSPEQCGWIEFSDIPPHIIGCHSIQHTSDTDKLASKTRNIIPETTASVLRSKSDLVPAQGECSHDESIIIGTGEVFDSKPTDVGCGQNEKDNICFRAQIEPKKLFGCKSDTFEETMMAPVFDPLPDNNKAESGASLFPSEPIFIETKPELNQTSDTVALKPKKSRKRKLAQDHLSVSGGGDTGVPEIIDGGLEDEEAMSSRRSTRLRRKSVEIYRAQINRLELCESDSPVVSGEDTDSPNLLAQGRGKKGKGKKKENIEDIYLNKLYKHPNEKAFSTIYEDPNRDKVFSQRKQRRSIVFDLYTAPVSKTKKRIQKATKLGWGPTVRKKQALSKAEFDKKLQALEEELKDSITLVL